LPKNCHWYQTHELAWALLDQFNHELSIEDACMYFAHTNSAKCCMNKGHRRMADQRMFRNCRAYIPGEIEALKPDILVTQGNNAKRTVESIPNITRRRDGGMLTLGDRKILWIDSYHPRYGEFWNQKRDCWPRWRTIVGKFWDGQL
jgi:uracil-DNA glycosylase